MSVLVDVEIQQVAPSSQSVGIDLGINEGKLESFKKQVLDLQMMYNNILRQNVSTIILQQEIEELKKLVKIKDKIIMHMSNKNTVPMKPNENT